MLYTRLAGLERYRQIKTNLALKKARKTTYKASDTTVENKCHY